MGSSRTNILHDHVVRKATAMVAEHPEYAAALADPDDAGTLYGIAVRRVADARNARRRKARRAQRQARRITRRR